MSQPEFNLTRVELDSSNSNYQPYLREPLRPELGEHAEELLQVVAHVRLDVLLQRLPVLVLEQVRDGRAGRQRPRLLQITVHWN